LWRRIRAFAQVAAIGQSPFAKDIQMAGFVHHLGGHELLGFVLGVVDLSQPASGNVARDELDFGKERGQLAHGVFNIVG